MSAFTNISSDTSYSMSDIYAPMASSSSSSTSPSSSSSSSSTRKHGRKHEPNHIPRPLNSFILFRKDYAAAVQGHQNTISKNAGKAWRSASSQVKDYYANLARRETEQHKRLYPGYVYAPKPRSGMNDSKAKVKVAAAKKAQQKTATASQRRGKHVQRVEEDEYSSLNSDSEYVPPRPQLTRAASRRAAAVPQQVSPRPSIIDDAFVPTDEIPELKLDPAPQMMPVEELGKVDTQSWEVPPTLDAHQQFGSIDHGYPLGLYFPSECSMFPMTYGPAPPSVDCFDYDPWLHPYPEEENMDLL